MALSPQVQEIKNRLNIVDVVSQYVKLTKAGKNYKGLSPFKKEKTPSFFVSPERNSYYCFSTQKGGDAFSFIEEMEGVDFKGALKILAEKAGVKLTPENPETRKKTDRLYVLLDEATRLFEASYAKNADAQKYLSGRGLLEKTASAWRVGYAAKDWRVLREHFLQKGYTDQELLSVGLIKKSDEDGSSSEPYDRFRGRIMFPIFDTSERVVAYSGRLYPDDGSGKSPKYLNSPETELFNKSAILYGYSKAKNAIRRYNFSILVEGQMDLLMSHQGGFPNTVAVSGTGLTEQHLELLSRISKNVVMAFDADSAGIASATRGAILALQKGMDVKIASVPSGKDPADAVKEDPNLWKQAIRESKQVIDFHVARIASEGLAPREREMRVKEVVLPFIKSIASPLDQAHFVSKVATFLGVREEAVWDELQKVSANIVLPAVSGEIDEPSVRPPAINSEERIIRLIGALLFSESAKSDSIIDREAISSFFADIIGEDAVAGIVAGAEHDQEVLFEADQVLAGNRPIEVIDDMLERLHLMVLKEKLREKERKLRDAEASGEVAETERLLTEIHTLSKDLAKKPKI